MLVDWVGIEFDIIQDKTFMLFSSNSSNSVPHYITATSKSSSIPPPREPSASPSCSSCWGGGVKY
jgi:hypothetical protein